MVSLGEYCWLETIFPDEIRGFLTNPGTKAVPVGNAVPGGGDWEKVLVTISILPVCRVADALIPRGHQLHLVDGL